MVAIERKDKVGFVTDSFIRHLLLPGGKVGAESVGEAPSTRPRQDLVSGGPGRDPPTTGALAKKQGLPGDHFASFLSRPRAVPSESSVAARGQLNRRFKRQIRGHRKTHLIRVSRYKVETE